MSNITLMRTMAGLTGFNTLTLVSVPLRFQIAPGTGANLGIANVDYTLRFEGEAPFQTGQTDANGEIGVPLVALVSGQPILTIFDTEYGLSLHSDLQGIATLAGQQKRLDALGYMSGYQLVAIASDTPDDGLDGPRTQQSILNFQMDGSLAVDGDVGNATKRALKAALGET